MKISNWFWISISDMTHLDRNDNFQLILTKIGTLIDLTRFVKNTFFFRILIFTVALSY